MPLDNMTLEELLAKNPHLDPEVIKELMENAKKFGGYRTHQDVALPFGGRRAVIRERDKNNTRSVRLLS